MPADEASDVGGKVAPYGMTYSLRSGRLAGGRGAGRSHPPRPASLIHRCEYLSSGATRRIAPALSDRVNRRYSGPVGPGLCRIWIRTLATPFRRANSGDTRRPSAALGQRTGSPWPGRRELGTSCCWPPRQSRRRSSPAGGLWGCSAWCGSRSGRLCACARPCPLG